MGKIIELYGKEDPWKKLIIAHPQEDAPGAQLFEYAVLTLLNALMEGMPTDRTRDVLRRTTVAYLKEWHPEIKAPPL
jgi:hypothetical protein